MRRFFLKLLRRHRMESDLEAELSLHRDLAAVQGHSSSLGNTTVLAEQSRDLWRFNFIENIWRDIVYGTRSLRRSPALVVTAVLSLALGIGVNTSIFSLATELMLSRPSVRDASSLLYVQVGGNSHSPAPVLDFIRRSGFFEDVFGISDEDRINWNDGKQTHPIFAALISKNFFSSAGVPVQLGRGIRTDDPDNVVILHHLFWERQFHGDPNVLGQRLELDGRPYTIVGILPASYRTLTGFGLAPEVLLPTYGVDQVLAMYVRLKQDMQTSQGLAGLRTIASAMDAEMPSRDFKYTDYLRAIPLTGIARFQKDPEAMTIGFFFILLLTLAGLVLLIACVNVAGMLLARASMRRREIAIRLSLGSSRGRLLQQLLVESSLLAILGSLAGLLLTQAVAIPLDRIQLPIPAPIHLFITLDRRLLLYAIGLTFASTLICGLLPARQAVRESLAPDLQRDRRMRIQKLLVAGQIAISVVVLACGFLFVRNLSKATAISPGFDVLHTLHAQVSLPPEHYSNPETMRDFVNTALQGLNAIPGIQVAAAARTIPFSDSINMGNRIKFADNGEVRDTQLRWDQVTHGFFQALDIPLLQGAIFTDTSPSGATRDVVVNDIFVQKYLGGRPPVGTAFRRIPLPVQLRIVGVVKSTKTQTIGEDPQPQLYEPLEQTASDKRYEFVMRSALPPADQVNAVREVLRRVEPDAGLEVATMYSSMGLAFLPSQVGAILMGSIGILGLLLAAVGLYGMMFYSVTRRTREIGVRMAIGATRSDVSRMILRDVATLVGSGSAIGILIAAFAVQPLGTFLVPGLHPVDPTSFIAVIAVLAITAAFAALSPLRRALSVDPASSLRHE